MRRVFNILILLIWVYLGYSQAVLNLSCEKNLRYKALSGDWEFYWNKLLTPKDFIEERDDFIIVKAPNTWTRYKLEDESLPVYGYATYRVKVILPNTEQLYAFKVPRIYSAYKLWLNDSLIIQVGEVGDRTHHKPLFTKAEIITFKPKSDTIEIVIQVSNYSHRKSGMLSAPIIGEPNYLYRNSLTNSIFDFLTIGGFLLVALYHFWLFNYRRRYYEALYFAIAVLASAIFTLFSFEALITNLIPRWNWDLFFKVNYVSNAVRVMFLLIFMMRVFKGYFDRIISSISKLFISVLGFVIILSLITVPKIYSYSLILIVMAAVYTLVLATLGYIKKMQIERNNVILIAFGGVLVLGLTILNDLLIEYLYLPSVNLSNLGLFIFISTQVPLLTERHTKIHKTAQRLTRYFEHLEVIKREIVQIPFDSVQKLLDVVYRHFDCSRVLWFEIKDSRDIILRYEYNGKGALNEYNISFKDRDKISSYGVVSDVIEMAISVDKPLVFNSRSQIIRYLKIKYDVKFTSLLVGKVLAGKETVGILYLEKQQGSYTKEDRRTFVLISTHLGSIFRNIQIFKELRQINENLLDIVRQRTAQIEEHNKLLMQHNVELDEKIEELRVAAEVINEMNKELLHQKKVLEQKTKLLKSQNEELERQKRIIEEINEQITDSLNYAKRIQHSLLTAKVNLPQCPHYIFYKSSSIVSGDFWWISNYRNYRIIAIGDTKNKDIKGAFYSVISYSILNEILFELYRNQVVRLSADRIKRSFFDYFSRLKSIDPKIIDLNIILIDKNENVIEISDGGNFVYLAEGKKLIQLAPLVIGKRFDFKNVNYMFLATDGLLNYLKTQDSNYSDNEFTKFVESLLTKNLREQKDFLEKIVIGKLVDDILVIGIYPTF